MRLLKERAFGSLTQRIASSATLQPFVRRVFWIWVTGALLLVCGAAGASAAKPVPRGRHAADQRLNVVLILSDDERSDGTADQAADEVDLLRGALAEDPEVEEPVGAGR